MIDYGLSSTVMPTGGAPRLPNFMPGTLSPEEQEKQRRQTALVDALRTKQSTVAPPQGGGGVVTPGGYVGQGMDTAAIGGALKGLF